jgi:hypothetical protein
VQELEKAKTNGGLSDIIYCFSQEPGMPRTYVQDGIDINADRLQVLLSNHNAHYYISGDATMAASIAAVLQKAIGPEMAMKMQSEGRWHESIFGPVKLSKVDAAAAAAQQSTKLKRMEWDAKARGVLLVCFFIPFLNARQCISWRHTSLECLGCHAKGTPVSAAGVPLECLPPLVWLSNVKLLC